jgi:hypothetical protein
MKKGIMWGLLAVLLVGGLTGCASIGSPSKAEQQNIEAQERERAEKERRDNIEAEKQQAKKKYYDTLVTAHGRGLFDLYFIAGWESSFPEKQNAKEWLDSIVERSDSVRSVVRARQELYDKDVSAFKYIPSRVMRDTVLKDKNNLIEAYNRYKPINADINKMIDKGLTFVKNPGSSILPIQYPGLPDDEAAKKIAIIEKEYANLVDTYPVN